MNEEQFMEMMDAQPQAYAELVAGFKKMAVSERTEEALAWSELLLEAMLEQDNLEGAVATVRCQAEDLNKFEGDAVALKGAVSKVFSRHHELHKLVEASGFESGLKPAECFKRLEKLRTLDRDMLVFHPTWGFGQIERVDFFYEQIEIDFEKKRGEVEMALAYAAESLEILDDEHLLAIRHNDKARMAEMVKKEQGEVVKLALKSYGEMAAPQLQELLSPMIVAEDDWKRFWDGARKALKEDSMIEMPSKRAEPIRLLDKEHAFDDEWFEKLTKERDMQTLLDKFETLEIDGELSEVARGCIANRLQFVATGAARIPEMLCQVVLHADLLGIENERFDSQAVLDGLFNSDGLLAGLEKLQARFLEPFVDLVLRRSEGAWERFAALIPIATFPVLNEIMELFEKHERGEECATLFRGMVGAHKASVQMLLWLSRNPAKMEEWDVCSQADFSFQVLNEINKQHSGHDLRAQNLLKSRVEDGAWLKMVLEDMREAQRDDFMRRLNASTGWQTLDRNAIVAKVVKMYPELHQLILKGTDSGKDKVVTLYSSICSYNAKKEEFRKLVQKEIPKNAREIEVARSYGDLRENAEYKAAKEKQRQLGIQAEELEAKLDAVIPTDFTEFGADQAGMATCVELEYADGARETYTILGYWDSDERRNIISSQTRMAQALTGYGAGEMVDVPSAQGAVEVKLVSVTKPSAEILAWAKG
ncbi:GreA/GreB family elongation factor [Verrucomicrobiota bacterium]